MWSIPTRPAGGTFQDRKAVHSAGARSLPARPAGGSPQDERFTVPCCEMNSVVAALQQEEVAASPQQEVVGSP